MKNIFKTIRNHALIPSYFGGVALAGVLTFLPSLAPPQFQNHPTVKRLSTYKGSTFPGFTELRVQDVKFDQMGIMSFVSPEPYDQLVNVNYITKIHRFEDAKKTDYSCLMFFSNDDKPVLVRMPYRDVYSSLRKAAEAQVK